jgi:hypothetical protein
LAFCFSSQVLGLIPWIKNPNLAERFTATILTANKKAALRTLI